MTARYGRKKRRKHAEEVKVLKCALTKMTHRAERAERILHDAKNVALQEFIIRHDLLKFAIDRISLEIGKVLGPKLAPFAKQILEASRKAHDAPFLTFDMPVNCADVSIEVLRGEIHAIAFNISLDRFKQLPGAKHV